MGAPVVVVPERFALARSVVAGRFVNAYSTNDWVLSLNFRARSVCPPPVTAQSTPASRCQLVNHFLACSAAGQSDKHHFDQFGICRVL